MLKPAALLPLPAHTLAAPHKTPALTLWAAAIVLGGLGSWVATPEALRVILSFLCLTLLAEGALRTLEGLLESWAARQQQQAGRRERLKKIEEQAGLLRWRAEHELRWGRA